MCINCGDYVGRCSLHNDNRQVIGARNPDGTPQGVHAFYVDDKLCEHARRLLGHPTATFADQWFSLPDDVTCNECGTVDFDGTPTHDPDGDQDGWRCTTTCQPGTPHRT